MALVALLLAPVMPASAESFVRFASLPGGVVLADATGAAPILSDPGDAAVVGHAIDDLADDIGTVSSQHPDRLAAPPARVKTLVIVGTLGSSRYIDALAVRGRIDVRRLRGAWESFLIVTVARPMPGVDRALVIVGSDRRGTAYGVYELSRAIGVSPWIWWADVALRRHAMLVVAPGTRRFGPPAVRYRGIFLNDEDWGLQPWAARTHDPEYGNIGPKTYRRIFQLLLRLKANTLWPAMHKVSAPFNADPANARAADDWGIVMSASHAEPMLRNNVGEWRDTADRFNYARNPDGVTRYWRERVQANARFENLWPLGMRGIHDSALVGATTDGDKVTLLERIVADQRRMLGPEPARVPQLFTPYKEVLDVYRNGLKVPDDVTLVWPDDNFGYIRHVPDMVEQARTGGNGVYYHLSYLGAPLSYLWLATTPPALVQEEMTRAWDRNARRVWIANVGDIKPAEISIQLFMDLAWNVPGRRRLSQRAQLDAWAEETFGAGQGRTIGGMLDTYYSLNFERRPEHLQWWLPGQKPRASGWSGADIDARLARFAALVAATDRTAVGIPADLRDAWFELVGYPIHSAAAANRRAFANERYAALIDNQPDAARAAAGMARAADGEIKALTDRYNTATAAGKWRYMMAEEPADNQWRTMRISPAALPAPGIATDALMANAPLPPLPIDPHPAIVVEGEDGRAFTGWRFVQGLGRSRGALVADRTGTPATYDIDLPDARALVIGLLPRFPEDGDRIMIDVSIDGDPSRRIDMPRVTGSPDWGQAVLDNLLQVPAGRLGAGRHRLTIIARSGGVAIDRLTFPPSGEPDR
ncbi:glycosyl hydrolase 115 family protein [Sphingomonas montana]|uniref:glycosyl hydrolase 115 family protein n=1 Tax=Sphingomonas montana TaxID=1843236 RepID=UPI00096ED69A|nr:glycosyl hydrolase 115 family protein [Sphingomonas montana]